MPLFFQYSALFVISLAASHCVLAASLSETVWNKVTSAEDATSPGLTLIVENDIIAYCPQGVANATLALPTAGAVEVVPGDTVKSITLGVGTQTYTCTNNNWAVTSVSAKLYDISCQYNLSSISALSTAFNGLAANAINVLPSSNIESALGSSLKGVAGRNLGRLGSLSVTSDGSYTFDYRKSAGGQLANASDYATGTIFASQLAPIPSYNIPWLRITTVTGSLAKEVFQVQTAGGYPATNGLACTNGATETVPYSAQYWLYDDNLSATSKASQAATCTVPTTAASSVMVILTQAVQYGQTGVICSSITDCTTKCLAENNCVGFVLSTEDGQGYTKLAVYSNKLGYAATFTSGIVRSITNKEYVTRQGVIDACPAGQVSSADYLGCILPTCS